MEKENGIVVYALSSSKGLTKEICKLLNLEEGKITVSHFADGEVLVEPNESVRGKHVFIVQSTSKPVNDSLMEILICLDAVKRSSCKAVTCVIPYYGYARQDRQAKPRQPISSRLVADLLTAAGADRVVSIDLHALQIQGFFKIPNESLSAVGVLAQYFRKKKIQNTCVVSPDHGGIVRARQFAENLHDNPSLAIIDKRRTRPNVAEAMNIIGDVKGKNCVIIDDLVDTGGSLIGCINMLKENGAEDIYCCATHGVLSRDALERIEASPVKEFVLTNTIELTDEQKAKCSKLKVISVAPLLASAIEAIYYEKPISNVYSKFEVD